MDGLITLTKCRKQKLPSMTPSAVNFVAVDYNDYFVLLKIGLTTEQPVVNLKLSRPPPFGVDDDQ